MIRALLEIIGRAKHCREETVDDWGEIWSGRALPSPALSRIKVERVGAGQAEGEQGFA